MWSTCKITQKHRGHEDSALDLSQKIGCGYFYCAKHIWIKRNKSEDWSLVKQEYPQEIWYKSLCHTAKYKSYIHYCICWKLRIDINSLAVFNLTSTYVYAWNFLISKEIQVKVQLLRRLLNITGFVCSWRWFCQIS